MCTIFLLIIAIVIGFFIGFIEGALCVGIRMINNLYSIYKNWDTVQKMTRLLLSEMYKSKKKKG